MISPLMMILFDQSLVLSMRGCKGYTEVQIEEAKLKVKAEGRRMTEQCVPPPHVVIIPIIYRREKKQRYAIIGRSSSSSSVNHAT